MKNIEEILTLVSALEKDHAPDGWPAITMGDVSALANEVRAYRRSGQENKSKFSNEKLQKMAANDNGSYELWGEDLSDVASELLSFRAILSAQSAKTGGVK